MRRYCRYPITPAQRNSFAGVIMEIPPLSWIAVFWRKLGVQEMF